MVIVPPPSPFLGAKDLNKRYADNIRKLSNAPWLQDGDISFMGVDTFTPAHELPPGLVADAINKRFEDGRAWPRYGVNSQPWGTTGISGNICGYARFNDPQGFDIQVVLTDDWRTANGEDGGRGRAYRVQPGNSPAIPVSLNGRDIWGPTRAIPCYNGLVLLRQGNERHYFQAAAIANSAIQLNCAPTWNDGDLVLFDAVGTGYVTTPTISITNTSASADTLNAVTTTLFTGLLVTVTGITGASGFYYLKVVSSGVVSLYDTQAHAIAGTATGRFDVTVNSQTGTLAFGSVTTGVRYYVKTDLATNKVTLFSDGALTKQLVFSSATGKFYLERQADFPGFYGNGAAPLLAQPDGILGKTLWDIGFTSVNAAVPITTVASNVVTAKNHRLLPGDAVKVTVITLGSSAPVPTPVYANPISGDALRLYDTAINALAAGSTGLQSLADNSSPTNATIVKNGASGLPMPPGREGCYFQSRLCIVNGRDTLAISDPLDPLHFTPFTAAVTANMGESDLIQALVPLPAQDSLLILKENSVLIMSNFSQGSANWALTTVTKEYGCIAPLSVAQVGQDVWFLSRKGVASIAQTISGITQGVAEPVSKPMKKYIDLIDWRFANIACAAYWNNRFFLAVPLKGQVSTSLSGGIVVDNSANVVNNGWLVFNFLNSKWEGLWQGAALAAKGMSRLNIYGEERLTLVTADGKVSWLGDGFTDGTTPISDSLTTRIYTGGQLIRKLHLAVGFTWDTYAPSLTVTGKTPGYNETETLQPAPLTYDKTQYFVDGPVDYVPGTGNFSAPYRQDYAVGVADLLNPLEVHQNILESFRCRLDDWGVQFTVANSAGSCRLQSINVRAVAGPHPDFSQV